MGTAVIWGATPLVNFSASSLVQRRFAKVGSSTRMSALQWVAFPCDDTLTHSTGTEKPISANKLATDEGELPGGSMLR